MGGKTAIATAIVSPPTIQKVNDKDRQSSSVTQYTQHIRSTGILTTMLTNIDTVVASANPDCTRYRTQKVCYYK